MKPVTNKFHGRCRRCGQMVAVGDGLAEKIGTRWETVHVSCPPPPERPGMTAKQALRSIGLDRGDGDHDGPDSGSVYFDGLDYE